MKCGVIVLSCLDDDTVRFAAGKCQKWILRHQVTLGASGMPNCRFKIRSIPTSVTAAGEYGHVYAYMMLRNVAKSPRTGLLRPKNTQAGRTEAQCEEL